MTKAAAATECEVSIDESERALLGVDADGEICACSRPAMQLLGRNARQLCGHPVTAFIPALTLKRCAARRNAAYVARWYAGDARRQLLGVAGDGGLIPLEIAVQAASGACIAYLVDMQRAAADPGLGQEMRELERSLDSASESAMVTNRDGIIEYVNPAFEALTGFTRVDAIGETPGILKSGAHGREFYAAFWQSICEGKPFHGLFINRRKNCTQYYENLIIWPLADRHGAITHFVSLGTAAGERVRAAWPAHSLDYPGHATGRRNEPVIGGRLA